MNMERMHPQDLRAIIVGGIANGLLARHSAFDPPDFCEMADRLIAQLEHTTPKMEPASMIVSVANWVDAVHRAESAEGCLAEEYDKRKAAEAELAAYEAQNRGSIDQWDALERRAEAAEAQVKELEAWKESALKVMNGISFQAVGKELGVPLGKAVGPEILTGIRGLRAQISEAMDTIAIYEHYARTWYGPDGPEILATEEEVTQRRKDAAARLAAIDAAKAGELPMPDEGLAASCHLVAWGRQGWDAAAALRVELEREQAHSQEGTQIMGRLEAMATQARAEGEKAERERCANALAEWVEYRMADGDAVRILAFLQGGAHD